MLPRYYAAAAAAMMPMPAVQRRLRRCVRQAVNIASGTLTITDRRRHQHAASRLSRATLRADGHVTEHSRTRRDSGVESREAPQHDE